MEIFGGRANDAAGDSRQPGNPSFISRLRRHKRSPGLRELHFQPSSHKRLDPVTNSLSDLCAGRLQQR